jgi:hypothetical protein
MDPSTALQAIENEVDVVDAAQQRNHSSPVPRKDCANESFVSGGSIISFPFAWEFNSTVHSPTQIAGHASLACAFAWDMCCDDSVSPPFPPVFSADAPAHESKVFGEEGRLSETLKALQVSSTARFRFASFVCFRGEWSFGSVRSL